MTKVQWNEMELGAVSRCLYKMNPAVKRDFDCPEALASFIKSREDTLLEEFSAKEPSYPPLWGTYGFFVTTFPSSYNDGSLVAMTTISSHIVSEYVGA